MDRKYTGKERREFLRLDYVTPFACKVCSRETIRKILQGYTSDISQAGAMCRIKEKVNKDDILWISFDRSTLTICEELEKKSLIYQNGIIGKVVRVIHNDNATFDVGIKFLTKEEKNQTNIFPKIHFSLSDDNDVDEEEQEETEESPQENLETDGQG